MDDVSGFELPSSPSVNSVLKPPKPRIPLKELALPAAHEEDNTAARKRRVSFANVNKIKEFSAGAESMVVCHTPAYEEPFSTLSSDSSCPSGVEGWTPAKCKESNVEVTPALAQNENASCQSFFTPWIPGYDQIENLRTPLLESASYYAASEASDRMDLTGCVGRASLRNPTRFSVGMELTDVIRPTIESCESMDLTKGVASYQPSLDATGTSVSYESSSDDSDALELTDAVSDPMLVAALYSVNNTRYSVNGMDLTKAAMSQRASVGRRSSRYSLGSMDLTEGVGNDCIGLEFTEAVSEPRRLSTRYSMNDMDFTDAISRDDLTRITLKSMDCTAAVGDKLDCSVNSESSMDFTKSIYNINQNTSNRASTSDMMRNVEQPEPCKSSSFLALEGSLELNYSTNDSEDTPTTQTYNGTQFLSLSKDFIAAKDLTEQQESNKIESTAENKIGVEPFEIYNLENHSLLSGNAIQNEFIVKNVTSESSVQQLEDPIKIIHDKLHSANGVELAMNNPECEINECLNSLRREISATKENMEGNSCTVCTEDELILKPDEILEKEHLSLREEEGMDFLKPIVSQNILSTCLDQVTDSDELRENIVDMDISVSTPEKKMADERDSLLGTTLKQMTDPNDGGDELSVDSGENILQTQLLKDETMEVSFSESDTEKQSVEYIRDNKKTYENPRINERNLPNDDINKRTDTSNPGMNEEVNKSHNALDENCLVNRVNEIVLHEFENGKSSVGEVENNSRQINNSLNNVTVTSDITTNISISNTPFHNNITMTRGAASRYSADFHDVSVETGTEDVADNVVEQQSELESSLPLQQRIDVCPKAMDMSDVQPNGFKDGGTMNRKEKGGKRSFEVALEAENDTEESPVKQICLPGAVHIPNSETSVSSSSMDKLISHHEPVSDVLHPTMNTTLNTVMSPRLSIVVDVNIEGKSCSENEQLRMKTKIAEKQSTVEEELGNNFSLRVDLSTVHDVSKSVPATDYQNDRSIHIEHFEKPSLRSQEKNVNLCLRNNQSSDSFRLSVSQLDVSEPPISLNVLHLPQVHQPALEDSLQDKLFSQDKTASEVIESNPNNCEPNQSGNRVVKLKTSYICRKGRPLRALQEGMFACDLIPKWIEVQFSAQPNGVVTNTCYKLICPETELAIGEYLLQQVKSMVLPADTQSLMKEVREPRDTFLTYLAKNLSLICKYFGGNLKGNTLILEIVSCKQNFWAFVHVNIKYPKYVSAEDITISEQRIGELKLSVVRNIFGSIATGPDQLLRFASTLKGLEYDD